MLSANNYKQATNPNDSKISSIDGYRTLHALQQPTRLNHIVSQTKFILLHSSHQFNSSLCSIFSRLFSTEPSSQLIQYTQTYTSTLIEELKNEHRAEKKENRKKEQKRERMKRAQKNTINEVLNTQKCAPKPVIFLFLVCCLVDFFFVPGFSFFSYSCLIFFCI